MRARGATAGAAEGRTGALVGAWQGRPERPRGVAGPASRPLPGLHAGPHAPRGSRPGDEAGRRGAPRPRARRRGLPGSADTCPTGTCVPGAACRGTGTPSRSAARVAAVGRAREDARRGPRCCEAEALRRDGGQASSPGDNGGGFHARRVGESAMAKCHTNLRARARRRGMHTPCVRPAVGRQSGCRRSRISPWRSDAENIGARSSDCWLASVGADAGAVMAVWRLCAGM